MPGIRGRLRTDDGFTLVAVMGALAILTLFLLGSLAYALQGMAPNRKDQDAKASVAAAQAGIDDFVSRLNANDRYWVDNSADTYPSRGDASNAALSAAGIPVPGTGAGPVTYRYNLLSTSAQTTQTGAIRLRSTGRSRDASRTLIAQLQPSGFLRYIYFSDIETQDPALWDINRTDCMQHHFAVPPKAARPGDCRDIQFTGGDVIQGPLHSNDALWINGSVLFTDPKTETSWADGANPAPPASNHRWWGSGTPLASGYRPIYQAPIVLPAANTEIQQYADPAKSDVDAPGCQYTGQTRIQFQGTKMWVLSPNTTSGTKARCYNTATPNAPQLVNIPPVIYVRQLTGACSGTGIGYPIAGEFTTPGKGPTYGCQSGDAFVQGTATGQVTVATANDIVVTGDLKTTTNNLGGTDVIGLVANNYVWVHHPVDAAGDNLLSSANSVHEIDAAILSVLHSFLVQDWDQGAPLSTSGDQSSKLTVQGAIAQEFRGPVGTGSGSAVGTGYLKNYVYDPRLMTLPPPYFLKPVSAPWGVTKLTE
jgi:hypothetical protein